MAKGEKIENRHIYNKYSVISSIIIFFLLLVAILFSLENLKYLPAKTQYLLNPYSSVVIVFEQILILLSFAGLVLLIISFFIKSLRRHRLHIAVIVLIAILAIIIIALMSQPVFM